MKTSVVILLPFTGTKINYAVVKITFESEEILNYG